jgi:hypothetical protein
MVVPPFLLALLSPGAFERSPDFAGTFGGGVFVAILPLLIVMKIRWNGAPRVFGTAGGTIVPYLVLSVYALGIMFATANVVAAVP